MWRKKRVPSTRLQAKKMSGSRDCVRPDYNYYSNATSPGEGGSARLRRSETTVQVRRGAAAPHLNGNRRGGRRPPHPRRDTVSL